MNKILIIGANSAIATAYARRVAKAETEFVLVGRDLPRLENLAADLKVRGAVRADCLLLDVSDSQQYEQCVNDCFNTLGRIDVALIAHGTLPDQQRCELEYDYHQTALQVNGLSVTGLLFYLAKRMKGQGLGTIAVISSVAGDRGRQSNYVYGSAKALVQTYLQGLRNSLFDSNVHVLDIRPGFVDTPMTESFDKGLLWAQPETIAAGIDKAIKKQKDIIYLPFFWRWIMLVIRSVPESIFKKLKL